LIKINFNDTITRQNPKHGVGKMKKFGLVVLVLACPLLLCIPAYAEKPLTPENIEGVKVVDDAWVKDNHKSMKIYDVRKKAEYIDEHIPGAISNPYKEKSEKTPEFDSTKDRLDMDKFAQDKSAPIIVYCNGPRCWKSYKAAVLLKRAGYTKVHWYRNSGMPGWKSKGFPTE
jgi:rhodanese-related sulfurtransferase